MRLFNPDSHPLPLIVLGALLCGTDLGAQQPPVTVLSDGLSEPSPQIHAGLTRYLQSRSARIPSTGCRTAAC